MKSLRLIGVLIASFMLFGLVNVNAEAGAIAKIGDTTYDTIPEAIEAVEEGVPTTIEIIRSSEDTPGFVVPDGKNITIDFKGNTIQFGEPLVGSEGTRTQNMQLLKGSTVVLKNGIVKAAPVAKRLLQNYSNLTLEDITLDGTTMELKTGYALSFNNDKVNIKGNTNIYAHDYAFDVYYWTIQNGIPTTYLDGTQVTIDTTGTIRGAIEVAGDATPSKSKLDIYNINHEGKLSIDSDYESCVKLYGGTYTTNIDSSILPNTKDYKIVEENEKYVVYAKGNVLVGDIEGNGDITFDKELAYAGETVIMKISSHEGYELDYVSVIDENNNKIEIKDNTFIMPKGDAWIRVYFKAVQTASAPVIDEKTSVGVSDALKTENVLLESLAKDEKYKDLSVTVEVVVDDIKVTDEITKEFEAALENKKLKTGKIVSYFDITVAVKNTQSKEIVGTLSELTEKIQFTVALPELEAVKDGYTRNYYVIKKHGDKVEVLNGVISKDGKYLTFETSEFSTYALAYEDNLIENVEVPQTFDGISSTLILGSVALISVVSVCLYFKKEIDE